MRPTRDIARDVTLIGCISLLVGSGSAGITFLILGDSTHGNPFYDGGCIAAVTGLCMVILSSAVRLGIWLGRSDKYEAY